MFLSRAGLKTAKGHSWSQRLVGAVRGAQGIAPRSPNHAEHWSTLADAVERYRLAPKTIRAAVTAGKLTALRPLANGPWLFQQDDLRRWATSKPTRHDPAAPVSEQLSLVNSTK